MTHQPDTAVVFFSRGGNTRLGAEILSERLKARLIELKERKPGNALQALLRMKSRLDGDPWKEIAGARRVYLMSPIWAGSTVPAMNAFAEDADFTDKDVYVVTFQKAPDQRLSHREQQHLAGIVTRNHGSVRECYALLGAKKGQFAGRGNILYEIGKVRVPEDLIATAAKEEASAQEAVPVAEETVAVEEVPAAEEAPVLEEASVAEVPVAEEAPVAEGAPTTVEAPAMEEASVAQEIITAEEVAVIEEAPVAEATADGGAAAVVEAPVAEEVPVSEAIPAEEQAPAAEGTPAEDEAIVEAEALAEAEIQETA